VQQDKFVTLSKIISGDLGALKVGFVDPREAADALDHPPVGGVAVALLLGAPRLVRGPVLAGPVQALVVLKAGTSNANLRGILESLETVEPLPPCLSDAPSKPPAPIRLERSVPTSIESYALLLFC
jgi:hypothetical protein